MKQNQTKRRRIPPLTWICAVFGGLVLAYLGMMLMVMLTPAGAAEKLIIPMILLPLAWSGAAVWIFHSKNARLAARKTVYAILVTAAATMACHLLT